MPVRKHTENRPNPTSTMLSGMVSFCKLRLISEFPVMSYSPPPDVCFNNQLGIDVTLFSYMLTVIQPCLYSQGRHDVIVTTPSRRWTILTINSDISMLANNGMKMPRSRAEPVTSHVELLTTTD